jgi:hypothetical protein
MADLLVAAGADLRAKHPVFGATPADVARGNGHGELADRLTPPDETTHVPSG